MTRLSCLAIILLVASCNTVPSFIPAALPEPPALELQPPITTGIPSGLFLGTVSKHLVQYVEGQVAIDRTTEEAYSETVDANGLPLIQPDGIIPQVGAVARTHQANATSWTQITDVQASGAQLVVFYRFAGRRADGFQLEGTGTWTYRFEAPNRLIYSGHHTGSGFLIDDGRATSVTEDSTAALVSG